MSRLIKILSIISFATAITLFVFIVLNPIDATDLFSYFTLSLVSGSTFLVLNLFLRNSTLPTLINIVVVLLCVIPLFIHVSGIFEARTLEQSWPLFMSMLIFQLGTGKLSLLHFFQRNKPKSMFTIITALIILLIYTTTMTLYLLVVPDQIIHDVIFISVIIASLLFLVALILDKNKRVDTVN